VKHVVQIIKQQNVANYVAADKMLLERHPTLSWTPFVSNCINLMLKYVGKIYFIREVIDSGKSIKKRYNAHLFFV